VLAEAGRGTWVAQARWRRASTWCTIGITVCPCARCHHHMNQIEQVGCGPQSVGRPPPPCALRHRRGFDLATRPRCHRRRGHPFLRPVAAPAATPLACVTRRHRRSAPACLAAGSSTARDGRRYCGAAATARQPLLLVRRRQLPQRLCSWPPLLCFLGFRCRRRWRLLLLQACTPFLLSSHAASLHWALGTIGAAASCRHGVAPAWRNARSNPPPCPGAAPATGSLACSNCRIWGCGGALGSCALLLLLRLLLLLLAAFFPCIVHDIWLCNAHPPAACTHRLLFLLLALPAAALCCGACCSALKPRCRLRDRRRLARSLPVRRRCRRFAGRGRGVCARARLPRSGQLFLKGPKQSGVLGLHSGSACLSLCTRCLGLCARCCRLGLKAQDLLLPRLGLARLLPQLLLQLGHLRGARLDANNMQWQCK
jgi:hypothetical protein